MLHDKIEKLRSNRTAPDPGSSHPKSKPIMEVPVWRVITFGPKFRVSKIGSI